MRRLFRIPFVGCGRYTAHWERAVASPTPLSRRSLLPEGDEEDDFVFAGPPGTSATPANQLTTADVLAVMREPDVPEDQEFTRFALAKRRENFRRGEAARRERSRKGDLDPVETTEITVLNDLLASEESDYCGGYKATDAVPASEALPFDDSSFAETILKMEVDGQIDHVWQDTKKAHVEDVEELFDILRQMKVSDIVTIDVSQKTSCFDYIIVGTCEGARHINLASWAVSEADRFQSVAKMKRRKADELWEAVPVGRILVNLMQAAYREQVQVERKWAVARTMDPLNAAHPMVMEGRHVKQHGLWSLTVNLRDLQDFEVDYCKELLLGQR